MCVSIYVLFFYSILIIKIQKTVVSIIHSSKVILYKVLYFAKILNKLLDYSYYLCYCIAECSDCESTEGESIMNKTFPNSGKSRSAPHFVPVRRRVIRETPGNHFITSSDNNRILRKTHRALNGRDIYLYDAQVITRVIILAIRYVGLDMGMELTICD